MFELKDFVIPIVVILSLVAGFFVPLMHSGTKKQKIVAYIVFFITLIGALFLQPVVMASSPFGLAIGFIAVFIGFEMGTKLGLHFWKDLYPGQFEKDTPQK